MRQEGDEVNRFHKGFALCSAVAMAAGASGCGKPVHAIGGGASTRPSVTILLSDQQSEETAEAGSSAGAVEISGYGTFKGRVVVNGTAPVLPPLLAKGAPTKDAICAASEIPDESVIVSPDGGLANVFIYLKKVPGGEIPAPPTEPGVIDQHGCRFTPHAAIFRVDQPLLLKNDDPIAHNTAFQPQKAGAFNQSVSPHDRTGVSYTYTKAEPLPVRARCDFHSWMGSYHLPLDHPWGAVTNPDGTFEIAGVPGTEVEFVVWHETAGYISRGLKVTIEPDQTLEQEITVDAAKLVK
jgi:hypothetical protein